jgi:hypothetical protein
MRGFWDSPRRIEERKKKEVLGVRRFARKFKQLLHPLAARKGDGHAWRGCNMARLEKITEIIDGDGVVC